MTCFMYANVILAYQENRREQAAPTRDECSGRARGWRPEHPFPRGLVHQRGTRHQQLLHQAVHSSGDGVASLALCADVNDNKLVASMGRRDDIFQLLLSQRLISMFVDN